MIRRLLRILFQIIALVLFLFVLTCCWVVFDGMTDLGEKADVAVVPGHAALVDGEPGPILKGRLDRVVQLFKDGEFSFVIVSGATRLNGYDEAASMDKYLVAHAIPADSIIEDHDGGSTEATAKSVARIMKERKFKSVMIVTDYYHITRMKMALRHEGLYDLEQAHSGNLQKDDVPEIARDAVALYDYIGRFYLVPLAKKGGEELKEGFNKVREETGKAKDSVGKKIDSLPK